MRETWTFEKECFNWFSGDSFYACIRNLHIPTKYIRNVITFNEAIQIAEDFKAAERSKRNSYRDFFGSGADSYIKFYSFCMIRESPKPGL